ncbi:hypothetical protein PFISCL1PPCAC_12462, partial [Pristionchus fissidentatus]
CYIIYQNMDYSMNCLEMQLKLAMEMDNGRANALRDFVYCFCKGLRKSIDSIIEKGYNNEEIEVITVIEKDQDSNETNLTEEVTID